MKGACCESPINLQNAIIAMARYLLLMIHAEVTKLQKYVVLGNGCWCEHEEM